MSLMPATLNDAGEQRLDTLRVGQDFALFLDVPAWGLVDLPPKLGELISIDTGSCLVDLDGLRTRMSPGSLVVAMDEQRCVFCNTWFPEDEAVMLHGHVFCSNPDCPILWESEQPSHNSEEATHAS